MSELDPEEKEIWKAYEAGRTLRAQDASQTQKRHQTYAEALFNKDARNECLERRLRERDV